MQIARWLLTAVVILPLAVCSCRKQNEPAAGDVPEADREAEFIAAMHSGKAHVENREAEAALEFCGRAVELRADSLPARINLALAQLLMRQKKDPDRHLRGAIETLNKAIELDPDCTAALYLRGLAYGHLNLPEPAVADLEAAVRLDPVTAALRYQLAVAYDRFEKVEQAQEQYRKTIAMDPLHTSSYYKLAMYARKSGHTEEMREYITEFTRLREVFGEATRDANSLERCVHTRAQDPTPPAEPSSAGAEIRFVDVTAEWTGGLTVPTGSGSVFGVVDADGDERWDVVVAQADGRTFLWKGRPGGFAESELPAGPAYPWARCLIGDYDNQGTDTDGDEIADLFHDDVALVSARGTRLLRQSPGGEFEDVTEGSGLAAAGGVDGVWVDFDHDGDLDLLLAGGAGHAAGLWLNGGDGTFVEHSKEAGLPSDLDGVMSVASGDLHTDDAIDLVLARSHAASMLLTNARLGRFELQGDPPGPWPEAVSAAIDDVNNDGYPDVLLLGPAEASIIYSHGAGRRRIPLEGVSPKRGLFFDYDNDGWLDLLVLGAAKPLSVWRNLGQVGFEQVTDSLGVGELLASAASGAAIADFDNDGDGDLLLNTDLGPVFLRNDGGNANHLLRLTLRGTKANRTGLGARVEIRAGQTRVSRSFSRLPLEIGTGAHETLDSVRIVWTNGVIQNELELKATSGAGHAVVEKTVATGSCPFLFAWDGKGFRFVTDFLGNSPMGLSAARDKFLPADPTEYVWIGDEGDFAPRDGRYVLQINNCFREVLYLDEAHLAAVDHARGTEVHSVDKIQSPPFPPSELWLLRPVAGLRSAVGDDGTDWTDTLSRIDGGYSDPPKLRISQLRGIAEPWSLEFDFGPLPTGRELVLALTGWIQYGDASVNISASQNKRLPFIFPRLEVRNRSGEWAPVETTVGMPAGKTKTILVDLAGRLPGEADRLRLSTTFQLHWDRVALFERSTARELVRHALGPVRADLHDRGFFEISARGPSHPTTPDYDNILAGPPWRRVPGGWYTRFGDVLELVGASDNRFAILKGGDEMTLKFVAGDLPPVPDGWQRTFFFYSTGWDKDADYNVRLGDRVGPLPFHGMDDGLYGDQFYPGERGQHLWRLRYNTRYVPPERFASRE